MGYDEPAHYFTWNNALAAQLRLKLDRTPTYRREDFISSRATAEALRLVDSWPAWRGGALALVGPAGSGKTHLATAWLRAAGAQTLHPAIPVTADQLARLEGLPVLVEEADTTSADPSWSETLFHLINMAARPGGGLLLSARTLPTAWPAALPDLRSRLNALPVALLGEPDDAVLQALLERFFQERHIRPSEDLLPYLVHRIERSVAAAREIVARLDETAGEQNRAISKALARQILEVGAGEFDFGE
jgi:chromosomal replication initiation ATPase DnaA